VLEGERAEDFRLALKNVSGAEGRRLGSESVRRIVTTIQNDIISAGYITTRVFAGPQDLKEGLLVVTVKPGYLNKVSLSEGSDTRISLLGGMPVVEGELLNVRDVKQGLENFRRVPTASTTMELVPGPRDGETDIVVNRDQRRRFRGRAAVDNGGVKATGRYQGRLTFNVDNLLGMSDMFYASVHHSLNKWGHEGTDGYSAHYSIPLGYNLLSLNYDHYKYREDIAGLSVPMTYSGVTDRTRFDPFGGSCVTGEVSERLKRQWVCAERNAEYLEGALGRFTPDKMELLAARPSVAAKVDDESNYYKIPRPGILWNGGHGDALSEDGGKKRAIKSDAPRKTSCQTRSDADDVGRLSMAAGGRSGGYA
jgi:hypothetical protein